jgi:hypothetical protein
VITQKQIQTLTVGTHITYKMRGEDRPTNRDRVWQGEIIVSPRAGMCRVRLLDEGYEGEEEDVFVDKILSILSQKGVDLL